MRVEEKVLFCGLRGLWEQEDGSWLGQVVKYVGESWECGNVRRFVLQRDGTWKEHGKGYTFQEFENIAHLSEQHYMGKIVWTYADWHGVTDAQD